MQGKAVAELLARQVTAKLGGALAALNGRRSIRAEQVARLTQHTIIRGKLAGETAL